MKITKSKLIEFIKEELESVLQEMDPVLPNVFDVQPGGKEHEAEKAANVKFTRGPCKGMTAKEAMKKRCQPGPSDHMEND